MARSDVDWRRSELKAITDHADDYISLFDLELRHVFVNRAIARTLGRTPEEFEGKTCHEAGMPAEVAELVERHMRLVAESGEPMQVDYELPLPQGRRSLHTRVAPVKGPDGTVQALIVISRDYTDLRRAEALRHRQNEVMRAIASGTELPALLQMIAQLAAQSLPGRQCLIRLASEDAAPGGFAQPILAPDGEHLGTLTLDLGKERPPSENELAVASELAAVCSLAIRHRATVDTLLEIREHYQALSEHASTIICVTDNAGVVLEVNAAITSQLGWPPDEIVGRNGFEFVHPDDMPALQAVFEKLIGNVGSGSFATYRFRHRDGSWHMIEAAAKSRIDHRGKFIAVVNARDISESENVTQALRRSEERLGRALDASHLGMWDWDLRTGSLESDARCAEIHGWPNLKFSPTMEFLSDLVHPDDRALSHLAVDAHRRGETPYYEVEYRSRGEDGQLRWVCSRGKITLRDADGRPVRLTGTVRDIDQQKRMQESLDQAERSIQLLLEATDEGIIGLDADGAVSFVNPAAMRMLGYVAGDMLGHSLFDLVQHVMEGGAAIPREKTPVHRCLTERARLRTSEEMFWRSGVQVVPVEYSVSPIPAGGAVLVVHDVSEKRSLANQLHFQALHDPLTGLLNRRGFEVRLNEMLNSAKLENREHALCYVDLDQFKLVNDTCGHAAGDELLRQLPSVLQPMVRNSDVVARLGGDEFAILLQDCPLDRAAQIAGNVRDAVRAFRFIWQYRTFTIGASLGVVGITAESQGLVAVLGAADTACYVAKDQGPNHVHVSYPHDLAIIRRRGEMRWISRLRTALEEDRFALHFQSIASFAANAPIQHHELLIRLLDSKGELILPGAFIAAAERYQLMPQIDAWVVEHALRYLGTAIAPHRELQGHRFGINLSGESLRDTTLLDTIRDTLRKYKVPATMLYFEITETAAISNLGAAVEFMRTLRQIGCQLALDDFGSGMSSFSYLKHLPVDYLKIDGSFVKDILVNPVDQAIVRAINSVGQKMGIATIAEYVESKEVADCLKEMGVNYAQGFSIAMPTPLEQFIGDFRRRAVAGALP